MAKFILNDDGSFTQEKKSKKQKSKYEELRNVPFTGQSKTKNQTSGTYFKKSEGNAGQAIGYSALDALGNFTEGSLNFFEGMSDSARYAGANVLDFFGADKKAKEIRERARENDVEDIVNQWNHITAGDLSGTKSEKEIGRFKKVEDNSIFGEKSDQVIQGVGNSLTGAAVGSYLGAPITGVGKGANLARNVVGLTSFGSSAAGHATTEAYNEGANDFQAGVYGILSGAVESGSEMLFGGLGKINKSLGFGTGALDDVIVKKLTKNIGNTLFRNIATIGLKSAGEGVEEIASLLGEQLVRRMMNMDSKTLKELAEDGTLADTFVQGTLSSLISQAPSGISSTVQGRDYTTGLTRTQQQYVNEIAQQRMVEAQKRNARLRGIEKSRIEDRALTDFQKGRLADANKLQQVNFPGLSTKDMDLQQSAYKYGFNPNSEAIVTAKTMLDNRGIKSRFDADAFKNINGNAYWTNKDGVREVVFNPNASEQTILEEIAIHELTHDLMSSKNSKDIINNQNIMNYVSKLNGYKEARANVEKLYANKTKGMTAQQKEDYINEEIVADTLGKNIGSQEYIRRLIDEEPSVAKKIYDWVVNKVTNSKEVKNEKAYWNNVKNNFEKAYNMSYNNGNQADTRLKKAQDDVLFTQMMKKSKPGVEEELIVNDYNNYYEIIKDADNGYKILSVTPISKSEDYLKNMQKEWRNVNNSRKSTDTNISNVGFGYGNSNVDNVTTEGDETWIQIIDRILEEIESEKSNSTNNYRRSEKNKRELDNSSFFNKETRYSQQTEEWQSFLDKNFEAKGTKTKLSDIKLPGLTKAVQEEVQKQTSNALLPIANELKELNKNLTKVMNPSEIAQLTPQDANTTPTLPGINRNKVGDGKSKFFDNINEKTNMLNDEQKTAILSNDDVKYYDKVTNKDSLDKAFERLQNGGMHETDRWFNKDAENADATDVAEGWILLKQYADSGDTDGMVEVAKQMRKIGTKAGQTVQAFNILSRLTPEGMVKYAQSELLEAYDQMVKNKSKAWIDANRDKFDLKPNEVAFIMDTMKDVSTMEDGYDKRFKLAQIQKVLTDKLPPAKGAGMKAWMRISMLFNPKTQVRNVAGNALIAPVNAFGDMFASLADKVIGSKTGVRTTGNFNLKEYTSGMKKGLYESYNDFKHGVNTRNIEGNRFEVTEGKSFNDNNAIGKALNKVDNLLSFVLDAGDRGFYEASFVNSINNQMVLNNTTEVTQDMIDIATQEALSRTWQDNNEYTKFVMNMRNELNRFVHVNGYGLGDILIPFAKTPANLTKAIVDYSPVGLVSALNKGIKLNRSLTNGQYNAQTQHEFVQSLGKATAGTILYVLGYALAQAGITSGASDEDKDVSNFLKNTLGVNSYSIKIGNKTFTYDWAQPIAAPLSMMANMVQKQKEGATLGENITTTLDTGLNLLFEQSFLESLSNVLSQPGEIGTKMIDQFLDLPSRAVPTLFKQIADLVDGTQRQTYVKDKPIESMINEVKAKIPGLSYTLDPSVDTLGREIQKYGGKNNPFNVFLNPANVSTENISKSGQEIYRLYKETGETNIMPRVAPYYVNKKGKKIVLDTKQRAEYQKVSGSIIENNIAKLLELTEYKNMSDKDKASVVNDIVNYSYNIAQNQVLGTELSKEYERAYEYSKIGDISDYYAFTNSVDDTTAKTQRESVFNYLYNSELDDNQIAALYSKYYSTEQKLDNLLTLKIPMRQFIKFDSADIQGEYNPKTGKTISGSKKNAVIRYVNDLEGLSKAQKAIIIKSTKQFKFDNYNNDIIRYVNNLSGTANDKKVWLKSIGFDNYDRDVVRYIQSQGLSQEETEKKLKDLGFTIRDGRVYY